MIRILVTGADGFLGKEVFSILDNKSFDTIGISRNISGENYIYCDLSDPANVIRILDQTKPDFIVNLAAFVDFKKRDLKSFFPVNVLLPAILGNYCKVNDIQLVHSSSIVVHGFSHKFYSKNTEFSPNNSYGESKLLGDNIISASGCKASILRIGGIYGKNGPFHLGINKAIDDAIKGKLPFITGTGAIKRNYIYVKDIAYAIVKCIEERIAGVHYLGGEIKTIKSMLTDICEVFVPGKQPKYIQGDDSIDQIIENSKYFNITPFKAALKQML